MSFQTRLKELYPNAKYSFDTNVYISIWRDHYPPDVFPGIYKVLKQMINGGIIKSTYPVQVELKRQRDEIYQHFTSFSNLFIEPTKKEQNIVEKLVNNNRDFPKWGSGSSKKHLADPFVVALAEAYDLTVVTYETGTNQNSIGRACEILDIEVYKFSEVLREEGFSFG